MVVVAWSKTIYQCTVVVARSAASLELSQHRAMQQSHSFGGSPHRSGRKKEPIDGCHDLCLRLDVVMEKNIRQTPCISGILRYIWEVKL